MVLPPQRRDPEGPSRPAPSSAPDRPAPGAPIDRDPPRKPGEIAGVTLLIVIANVAIYGLMVASGVSPWWPSGAETVPWGANYGLLTLGGEWWRLITACFIHGGLIHLGFNMYVLWDLGRATERIFGSLGFTIVYFVAGIGGSFASVMNNPLGSSVGASGAVFGIAGAFVAFLLRNRKRIDPKVSSHLWRSLGFFVVVNLAIGYRLSDIVDQAAHIGGLVTGFAGGFLASPKVGPKGPERAYWAYPIVAITGVALCAIVWAGFSFMPR